MPGWHAKTTDLVKAGKLTVIGVAPEQHGDRMALFQQWKGMDAMPVMVDSYNLLGLKAVPITLLLDEAGVVRYRNPGEQDLADFLALPAAGEAGAAAPNPTAAAVGIELETPDAPTNRFHEKLARLERLVTAEPKNAVAHFQLGVAYRKRHDSKRHHEGDFQKAVDAWTKALELDPSNYIWRRRIQQYGPRLDKPYAFYDWIAQARNDLRARGIEPHPLVTEPAGAELAKPLRGEVPPAAKLPLHPDPDGNLPRDLKGVVDLSAVTVRHTSKPKEAMRVILTLKPNTATRKAKWNDEAGPSTVHVLPPEGWVADPAVLTLVPAPGSGNPLEAERTVDFEIRMTKEKVQRAHCSACRIDLFYHVCHGKEQVCEYLRRDYSVKILEHTR